VFIVNNNRIIKLFDCVQALENLPKLMLSLNFVNWVVEVFKISQISLNFCKAMSSLFHCIDWALQSLQFSNFIVNFSKFMFPVYIINWIVERLKICQGSLNVLETVLMFYRVYRTCQILDVIQILLNLVKLMVPIYIIHWVGHVLEVMDLSLYVLEDMVTVLNVIYRSNQVHQICHLLFHFIKMMFVVNSFPNWIIKLLQGVNSL